MCIGVPGQLLEIDGWKAMVEVGGARRETNVMLISDAAPGDWVLIHAGYAISKVDEAEALETLGYLREITEGLGAELAGDTAPEIA